MSNHDRRSPPRLPVYLALAVVACGASTIARGPSDAAITPANAPDVASPPPEIASVAPDAGVDGTTPLEAPPDAGAPKPFVPADVEPMNGIARSTDGRWSAVPTDGDEGVPLLFKTVLHPDKAHPAAELYVVAIDLARVRLRLAAGSVDPVPEVPAAKSEPRPALIPADQQPSLVAAFNGGWKGEHGHFGIRVDGVTFVAPRDGSCTISVYDDDTIHVGPWKDLAPMEPHMRTFRQTPACMFANGVRHPGLAAENTTSWGADADGAPVIRRSAFGLDERGEILLVGLANPMTAPAIADGMHHAGARNVAELDVNWSFPKFLVYRRSASGALEATSLFPNFVFDKGEYVRQRSPRDFFFLTRR